MTQKQTTIPYANGQICHTAFHVTDVPTASKFLEQVFGWTAEVIHGTSVPYAMLRDPSGRPFLGVTSGDGNIPSRALPYVQTNDLDACCGKVESFGGHIVGAPVHIPELGTYRLFQLEGGPMFAAWQDENPSPPTAGTWKHQRTPYTIVGRPIGCTAPEEFANFFSNVFGWECNKDTDPNTGASVYMYDDLGGAGGLFYQLPGDHPEPVLEQHILVQDLQATTDAVLQHGGSLVGDPVTYAGYGTKQDVRIPGGPVIQLWVDDPSATF